MKKKLKDYKLADKCICHLKEIGWTEPDYDYEVCQHCQSSKSGSWEDEFDKKFVFKSYIGEIIGKPEYMGSETQLVKDVKTFIHEELEKALDTQRMQHSRTMAILIKDHKEELERAKEIGFDRGYRTKKLIKQLKGKDE